MTQQIQSIDNLRSNETVLQACRVCEPMPAPVAFIKASPNYLCRFKVQCVFKDAIILFQYLVYIVCVGDYAGI